jgi:Ankyrin repeats (3 copies)
VDTHELQTTRERCIVMPTANYRTTIMTDIGVVLISATAVFTARAVCEQTLVTWGRGAQSVGFSQPHSIVDLIGLLCVLLTLAWAFAVIVLAASEKSRLSATELTLMAVLAVSCGVRAVPYQEWQLLTVRLHGTTHVPKKWVVSAAANGEVRVLDYLLTHGVDVNTRTQRGESLLGAAAAAGQMDAARMLIARGANLDSRTDVTLETPLTEAAQMNHTDMVRLLLEHGANPGVTDVLDRRPSDWAQENRNYQMAGLLRERAQD